MATVVQSASAEDRERLLTPTSGESSTPVVVVSAQVRREKKLKKLEKLEKKSKIQLVSIFINQI